MELSLTRVFHECSANDIRKEGIKRNRSFPTQIFTPVTPPRKTLRNGRRKNGTLSLGLSMTILIMNQQMILEKKVLKEIDHFVPRLEQIGSY